MSLNEIAYTVISYIVFAAVVELFIIIPFCSAWVSMVFENIYDDTSKNIPVKIIGISLLLLSVCILIFIYVGGSRLDKMAAVFSAIAIAITSIYVYLDVTNYWFKKNNELFIVIK